MSRKHDEAELWKDLRTAMGSRWDAMRIENALSAGTPDVTFGMNGYQGWFELKVAKRPVRATTQIDLGHLTPTQCLWLCNRDKAGDRAYLFLKVLGNERDSQEEYYLIPGKELSEGLWNLTEQKIFRLSVWAACWIDPPTLINALDLGSLAKAELTSEA